MGADARALSGRASFQGRSSTATRALAASSAGHSDLKGKTVFVLHPHQTRYVVPASSVHVLPGDVPPARAVLAANLETALNGLWDARPHVGDRVVVIGARHGRLPCRVARGADSWLRRATRGRQPASRPCAERLGVSFARPADAAREADVVIHASGSPEGLQLALDIAGVEATIVEMSWFGDRQVPLPLGGAFHSKRLTIKSSQVGRRGADAAGSMGYASTDGAGACAAGRRVTRRTHHR